MIFERRQRLLETLPARARILSCIRDFFTENGYIEVETPVCISSPLPEPHIDALKAENGFLQTSPEICMKPLLAAGFEKIFQLCRCFRRGERGRKHLPEFTMLEWYEAGASHADLMPVCENLLKSILKRLNPSMGICYQSHSLDLAGPWPRMSVEEAFDLFGSESMKKALSNNRFDEIMGLEIEPCLGMERPVFLCSYPSEKSCLAAPEPENPETAQRFELYIGGLEICNGCTELADAELQRRRFEKELEFRSRRGRSVYESPEWFLEALTLMPDAAGCALGVDRLVMLLTDSAEIDEVVAFLPAN